MDTLDVRADKEEDDEGKPVWKDYSYSKDVFKAFFSIIAPSKESGISKKKRAYRNYVSSKGNDRIKRSSC